MNSLVYNNIVHNVSYCLSVCTEINNRFNRILHFADQNVMPNIANGTSSVFHNDLISYLCTNSTISNILLLKLNLDRV